MEEGRQAYHPALLLKVWLYAYALGVTSARRLEQRVREDLAFRYLAAGAGPDFWTLNQFRTRHARALNDLFTQVVELARSLGMGRLGHVAMDSTRVAANASRDRVETVAKLRAERAKIRRQIRRWQKQCDAQSCEEAAGQQLSGKQMAALEKRLEEIPRCLERLRKSGLKRRSETDPDSRFLRDRKGFTLGYTAEVAVSEDHLIVEQRVGQNATDNATLVPLVETVERRCRERPQKVSADSGFFCLETIVELAQRGLDVYVPDSNLARELNRGQRAPGAPAVRHPEHRRMRRKLRDPAGRAVYQRRKAIVEPVIGVLKEQRGMRQFRRRGLGKVAVEFALAATAFNLTRLWRNKPKLDQEGSFSRLPDRRLGEDRNTRILERIMIPFDFRPAKPSFHTGSTGPTAALRYEIHQLAGAGFLAFPSGHSVLSAVLFAPAPQPAVARCVQYRQLLHIFGDVEHLRQVRVVGFRQQPQLFGRLPQLSLRLLQAPRKIWRGRRRGLGAGTEEASQSQPTLGRLELVTQR